MLSADISFRMGRFYETFWNSQSNLKYGMVLAWPAYISYIRWRAESSYKSESSRSSQPVK